MNQFSSELSEQEYSMWFNIEYDSSTQDTILVRVPSIFYRDQLAKTYQQAMETKLFELSGKRLAIEFVDSQARCSRHQRQAVPAGHRPAARGKRPHRGHRAGHARRRRSTPS